MILKMMRVPKTIRAIITQKPKLVGIMTRLLSLRARRQARPSSAAISGTANLRLRLLPFSVVSGHLVPRTDVGDPSLVPHHHHLRSLGDPLPIRPPRTHRLPRPALRVNHLAGSIHRDRNGDAPQRPGQVIIGWVHGDRVGGPDLGHGEGGGAPPGGPPRRSRPPRGPRPPPGNMP